MSHNNNAGHHLANTNIPNWGNLSPGMKGRYFRWKNISDACWEPKYKVIVSFRAGQSRWNKPKVQTNMYQFSTMADVQYCKNWWLEYNPNNSVSIVEI